MDGTTITSNIRNRLGRIVSPGYPEKGMSLRELAKETGVSFPTLSRFLRGETASTDTLDKLAAFVDRAVDSVE